ncbi:helix-turn-helix domain-containing protein [Microbacterium resistens]|uniref:helix-turn-helix domain-containing protein n=1 Tax=Microbacterium resistens TaxID=156977 RepID=UPI000829DB22|nr:helix-turn-helix transcriptional regulator [Microbacterium resistens]
MPTPSEIFVSNVRAARRGAALSQAELADMVTPLVGRTIDSSAVTRIERGDRAVRLDEAVAIAEVLEIPLAVLIGSIDVELELYRAELELEDAELRLRQAREEVKRREQKVMEAKERVTELHNREHLDELRAQQL